MARIVLFNSDFVDQDFWRDLCNEHKLGPKCKCEEYPEAITIHATLVRKA